MAFYYHYAVLEVAWNKSWKGIEVFEYCFLYIAYADDKMFFLKDSQSITCLVELFNTFSVFYSGLKPNLTKCEIRGIGTLKWV